MNLLRTFPEEGLSTAALDALNRLVRAGQGRGVLDSEQYDELLAHRLIERADTIPDLRGDKAVGIPVWYVTLRGEAVQKWSNNPHKVAELLLYYARLGE